MIGDRRSMDWGWIRKGGGGDMCLLRWYAINLPHNILLKVFSMSFNLNCFLGEFKGISHTYYLLCRPGYTTR